MPEVSEKGYEPKAIQASVVQPQVVVGNGLPSDYSQALAQSSIVWAITQAASEIIPWGINPTRRDLQLRQFLTTESVVSSAFAAVIARNAGYSWRLDGPPLTVRRAQNILHSANGGEGWLNFVTRLWWDASTQDKGGFIEIIREGNSPDSPCIGIQSLDAARCFHTGDPENPVVYLDRKGRFHLLAWYQVVTVSEMPMPHELLYGLQLCALSRVLHGAQVFRNIQIYMDEKTGGRNTRAIHVISGIAKAEMQAAIDLVQANADNRGQLRYIQPVILTTLQDKPISRETLELATLPDGFDSDQVFKQYLTIVSLGLLTDFQEFAPLPGGGLGTSAQSEVLHAKSRGKGAMLFRKIMEHIFNFSGILPQNVTFTYDEQDVAAEAELAKVRLDRANTYQLYVNMGLTDAAGVQQLALDDGDIPQELFDRMSEQQDLTDPGAVEQSDTTVAPEEDPLQGAKLKATRDIRPHGVAGSPKVETARLEFEAEMTGAIEGGFELARRKIDAMLMKAKDQEPEPEPLASVVEKVVDRDPETGLIMAVTEIRVDGVVEKTLVRDKQGRITGAREKRR